MWEKLKAMLKAQGYTDEQIKQVIDGMKSDQIYLSTEDNIDKRYEKLKTQKEQVEEELTTANTTITELKEKHTDLETLQTKITEYETEIGNLKTGNEAKIKNLAITHAINDLLKAKGVKYPELLSSKFDRDSIVVDADGNVDMTNLETQFTPMQETYKELIGAPATPVGRTPNPGVSTPPAATGMRAELEGILNDPNSPLPHRIAAKRKLSELKED